MLYLYILPFVCDSHSHSPDHSFFTHLFFFQCPVHIFILQMLVCRMYDMGLLCDTHISKKPGGLTKTGNKHNGNRKINGWTDGENKTHTVCIHIHQQRQWWTFGSHYNDTDAINEQGRHKRRGAIVQNAHETNHIQCYGRWLRCGEMCCQKPKRWNRRNDSPLQWVQTFFVLLLLLLCIRMYNRCFANMKFFLHKIESGACAN